MSIKYTYNRSFNNLFSGFNGLLLYKSGGLVYDGNESKTQGGTNRT